MNDKPKLLAFILMTSIYTGCRNDPADRELDWSCADTKAHPHPTATPECLTKIKAEQPIILESYNPVPVMKNGALSHYAIIEKDHSSRPIKK